MDQTSPVIRYDDRSSLLSSLEKKDISIDFSFALSIVGMGTNKILQKGIIFI